MKSENRQRTAIVAVRFTPEDHRKLQAAAKRFDTSVSDILRWGVPDLIEFGGYK